MPHVKFSPMTSALVVALALSLTALLSGARAQETTLLSFDANNDNPAVPYSGVIFDKEGNLYGTLMDGGGNYKNCEYGCGAVYELTADGTENLLYQFQGMGNGSSDGALPYASLVRDSKGNLYGTTHVGGTDNFGTVFKVTPEGVETILHSFTGGSDGCRPVGSLLLDGDTLYGTASDYACGNGTVFSIPKGGGTLTTLYTFCQLEGCADGQGPQSQLVLKNKILYGTTQSGGAHGVGTVFQLPLSGTESVIYSFAGGNDGADPIGGVVFGKSGNLYGTTYSGGGSACNCGTLYEVTLAGVETQLLAFNGGGDGGDGSYPQGSLIKDSKNNLYGFAEYGGTYGSGTVYELSPGAKNTWTFNLLYNFDPQAYTGDVDGRAPLYGSLVMDASGNLYGTTISGGAYNYGIVFKITP